MTDAGNPNWPVELELYSGGTGIIRTELGWYYVVGFARTDTLVQFEMDTTSEVAPSELDRQILRRAAVLLSSEARWNRADNRKCPSSATTWSIYCAVERASIEVAGGFHHRRPAAELVRELVDQRTKGRGYHHRLMDYNNDPTTRLSDVQSLFSEAQARIADPPSPATSSLRR